MSFPEIYLDAINRQARELFARKDADEGPARSMVADLKAELARLDAAISSINGQLETRTDNPEWRASARRALRGYMAQKTSLKALLKSARVLLQSIVQTNAMKAKLECKAIGQSTAESVREFNERVRKEKEAERLVRIAAANEESNRFNVAFRKVVRAHIGEAEFFRLMEITKKL